MRGAPAAEAQQLRNVHDVPLAGGGLTLRQKYSFDLNGFLVIRNAFDADMVQRATAAIDAPSFRFELIVGSPVNSVDAAVSSVAVPEQTMANLALDCKARASPE